VKLFISYARLDRHRVDDLVSLFRKTDHSVWYDYRLLPGQTWQQVLSNQIKDCDVFVATLSDRALASEWCQWELSQAFTSKKRILPIALSSDITIPDILNALHVANFTDLTTTSDLDRILGGLAHINSELSSTFFPDISPLPKGRPSRDEWLDQHKQNSAHMHLSHTLARLERNQTPSLDNFQSAASDSFSGFIGIDFGTSTSLCAVFIDDQLTVIPNRFGNTSTSSAIYIHDDGSFSIGESAVKAALRDPRHAVLQVKRLFGTDALFRAYGKNYTAPQLAAEIIKTLVEDCNNYLGAPCRDAVITAPAYFTETQLDDLRIAYQLAGINIKRVIAEPSAACLSFRRYIEKDGIVVVFDIGGGTFDVSIIEVVDIEGEMQVEVLSISGHDKLGSSDYDQAIVNYCIDCFMDQTGVDLTNNLVAQMRLRDAAEFAKIQLTSSTKTVIHVPIIHADASGSYDLTIPFTVNDFEDLTEHLTSRIMDCCKDAMDDAWTDQNFSSLFLIGQASRTPLIRKQAEKLFKCKANLKVEPDQAVVFGAAIQGYKLSNTANGVVTNNVLLLDVTSHALGITLLNGVTEILIRKNTTIPTKAVGVFKTTRDKQTHAIINVIQCSDESAKKNLVLSRIVFPDITPMPAGKSVVEVTFGIDQNSKLIVKITDERSSVNKSFSIRTPVFQPLPDDKVVIGELANITTNEFTESGLDPSESV